MNYLLKFQSQFSHPWEQWDCHAIVYCHPVIKVTDHCFTDRQYFECHQKLHQKVSVSFIFMVFKGSFTCFFSSFFLGICTENLLHSRPGERQHHFYRSHWGKNNSLDRNSLCCQLEWNASIIELGNNGHIFPHTYLSMLRVCAGDFTQAKNGVFT